MKVRFTLNHHEEIWDVNPNEYLLDSLRAHHITSVKRGCDTTSCSVCTVLLNRKPVPSCSVLTVSIEGQDVLTVEGIAKEAEILAEYMGHQGADQCGYCNPSLALTVHAMKEEIKNPSDEDIRAFLVGNLCRCTGYHGQQEAIKKYLEEDK
jgi:carbon-monoxide dehydrogenase small subunit